MASLPFAKPNELGLDNARFEAACERIRSWTTGPESPMPGAALLVARHGKMIEPRFFGKQGPEPDAPPIRRNAIFLLASITKPVVYLAAMKLVERGLLCLSDKVTRYLPDFAAHHKEEILISHLFTHTSGLPDMLPNNTELRKAHAPLEEFTRAAIRDTVPLFAPGTRLSYQSMGTLVVSEIIQKISGQSINAFLKQELFDPLRLKSTALGSKGLDADRIVRVQVPEYQAGSDYGWNSAYWRELGAPWGGMFSTPEDFAAICQLMLGQGKFGDQRLFAPGTIKMITTNRLDDYPDLPEGVRRTQPWGLGWRMNHMGLPGSWGDLLGRHTYGHFGATGTMFWIDPETQGFCLMFTSMEHSRGHWRFVEISNLVASAFM